MESCHWHGCRHGWSCNALPAFRASTMWNHSPHRWRTLLLKEVICLSLTFGDQQTQKAQCEDSIFTHLPVPKADILSFISVMPRMAPLRISKEMPCWLKCRQGANLSACVAMVAVNTLIPYLEPFVLKGELLWNPVRY